MHAESKTLPSEVGVAHIEDDSPRGYRAPEEPIEAAPERQHPRAKSKLVQHRKPGRLQDQAGAEWLRRLELLEKRDAVTVAMQVERCGKSGRAGSSDGDLPALHRPAWSPKSPRRWDSEARKD